MIEEVKILNVVLKGVKSISWKDKDTWVEISIPFGDIKYQQPKGKQTEIRLECYDWGSFYTIFFNTNISGSTKIVDPTTWKRTVFSTDGEGFKVKVKTINATYEFKFWDVRVRTIAPADIEESEFELTYIIELTAKLVKRTVA